jgi:hypothetical protein
MPVSKFCHSQMGLGLGNIDEYLKFMAPILVCYFNPATDEKVYGTGESL